MDDVLLTAFLVFCSFGLSWSADTSFLRTTIDHHFADIRHHTAGSTYKNAAKEFIKAKFTRFGLVTEEHNFQDAQQYQFTNVIGILKGDRFGTTEDKLVGLGAHYDTVRNSPGVDDNGSGVAALLEVARQITDDSKAGTKYKNTMLFVAFDLEEGGYVGSEKFVPEWLQPWVAANYGEVRIHPYGVIILDAIMKYSAVEHSQVLPGGTDAFTKLFPKAGANILSDLSPGDFIAVVYRKPDTTAPLVNDDRLAIAFKSAWDGVALVNFTSQDKGASRPEFEIELFPLPNTTVVALTARGLGDFLRSDHRNFWNNDINAIFLTDTANFRDQCYHKACDNTTRILTDDNVRFLGKTADAIKKTLEMLASDSTSTSGAPIAVSTMLVLIAVSMLQLL